MSNPRYVSDTLKKRKQTRKKIKVYICLFIFLLLMYGIVYLIRLPQVQIKNIEVEGTIFVEVEDIQKIVQTQLEKNILWVLPKSNVFLFSKKELYKNLMQDPAFINVEINKNYFDTIKITVTEHEKQTLFCKDQSYSGCFYVNAEGLLYSQVEDYVIPEQEIIVFSENPNLKIQDTVLESSIYSGVLQFIKSVAQTNIKIANMAIKNDGLIELQTRTGVKILVSVFDDFEKDFINFIALFEQGILTEESFNTIEYLDLRFGNKVFYKNKTN